MIRTIAPAKINWTLEVLGKRSDGYHEIRSVMQTIDLCDEVEFQVTGKSTVEVSGDYDPGRDDLTLRAARALEVATGRELPVGIRLVKRIPVAAGLGGGSSDAAAVLRGLMTLYGLEAAGADLAIIASGIGSDIPFFLQGGTALAAGRGEAIERLPDAPEAWLVVLVPRISFEDKTRRMYEALKPADFGDGQRTESLVARLRQGKRVREEDLYNAFERAAYESFEGLAAYRDTFLGAGATRVHIAGAGPALFAVFVSREEADGVAGILAGSEARVFVARALGAAEATRVEVESLRIRNG